MYTISDYDGDDVNDMWRGKEKLPSDSTFCRISMIMMMIVRPLVSNDDSVEVVDCQEW